MWLNVTLHATKFRFIYKVNRLFLLNQFLLSFNYNAFFLQKVSFFHHAFPVLEMNNFMKNDGAMIWCALIVFFCVSSIFYMKKID